ncbi:conjugal transfer protein [Actinomadura parmotrematis]|uniref:MinD-like ATPase involved in chromosome partitioning or flagellar assembly n=1 Tax=Actinomadura parmotrematis TaxID=2864039 RepID=A0ABS7FMC5_9ACTN|nr:conjugal transfer protein [Actinomadura parmotrematis]MBW8481496.1 hypothetical protein [Actinomadura parmotrematis]
MDLPTYTNIWRIEKRLYKLYDLRLPMPLPLVQIGVFVGVFVPWVLLLKVLGVPFRAGWVTLYLVPPGLLTFLATRPVIEGKRLTELLLSQGRYLSEPRTWCRLTPIREPREVVVVARVWRRAEQPVPAIAPERAAVKAEARRKARRGRKVRVVEEAPLVLTPAVASAPQPLADYAAAHHADEAPALPAEAPAARQPVREAPAWTATVPAAPEPAAEPAAAGPAAAHVTAERIASAGPATPAAAPRPKSKPWRRTSRDISHEDDVPAAMERPPATPRLEEPPVRPSLERAVEGGAPAAAPGSGKRAFASGVRRPGGHPEFWKAVPPTRRPRPADPQPTGPEADQQVTAEQAARAPQTETPTTPPAPQQEHEPQVPVAAELRGETRLPEADQQVTAEQAARAPQVEEPVTEAAEPSRSGVAEPQAPVAAELRGETQLPEVDQQVTAEQAARAPQVEEPVTEAAEPSRSGVAEPQAPVAAELRGETRLPEADQQVTAEQAARAPQTEESVQGGDRRVAGAAEAGVPAASAEQAAPARPVERDGGDWERAGQRVRRPSDQRQVFPQVRPAAPTRPDIPQQPARRPEPAMEAELPFNGEPGDVKVAGTRTPGAGRRKPPPTTQPDIPQIPAAQPATPPARPDIPAVPGAFGRAAPPRPAVAPPQPERPATPAPAARQRPPAPPQPPVQRPQAPAAAGEEAAPESPQAPAQGAQQPQRPGVPQAPAARGAEESGEQPVRMDPPKPWSKGLSKPPRQGGGNESLIWPPVPAPRKDAPPTPARFSGPPARPPQGTPVKPEAPSAVPPRADQAPGRPDAPPAPPQQRPEPQRPEQRPEPPRFEPAEEQVPSHEVRSGPASPVVRPRPRPLPPPPAAPPSTAAITPPDPEHEVTAGGLRRLIQAVGGGHGDEDADYELRIQQPFHGTRHIVVLGCTGGAGQTVTGLMLGHTFAQHNGEPVVAIDINPGPGALARRTRSETNETLTSLITRADQVGSLTAMRRYTSSSRSGLDVIAAGKNPLQALDDRDYALAIRTIDRFYSVTLLDAAAAVVARVLPYADQIVLVAPASADAPRAVSMTFEWLDGHGYEELRSRAVTVINGVSRRSMDDVEQAEAVARGRCRALVRIPWDDHLSMDRAPRNELKSLRAPTRRAYLALAGVVAGGFSVVPERYQELQQEQEASR